MTITGAPPAPSRRVAEALGPAALAALVAVSTAWAVVAAGWNEGLLISLAVAALAAVEAALVAGSTAGRVTAALAAPVLGVLVIVPLTLSGMPADGGAATAVHVASRYASALTTGVVSHDSFSFIVGVCGGMWLLGFWTSWVAVREHRGVLAVLPAVFVLASNVINARHPGDTAVPLVVALGAGLLLLARSELAALEWRWKRQRVVALPGTRRRYTAVALVAAAGTLVIGILLPPVTSADVSGRIFHFTVNDLGPGGSGGRGAAAGRGGQHQGAIGFSPDTQPGGPLVDDPRPVLSFTVDVTGTVYLRAVTDVVFSAGSWFPADATGATGAVPVRGPTLMRDRSATSGAVAAHVTTLHARVVLAPGGAESNGDRALFPGEPESIDRAGTAYGVLPPQGTTGLLTVDRVTVTSGNIGGAVLVAGGTVPTATESELRAAGTDYPSWLTDAGYVDVSAAGPDRSQLADIRTLALQWTAGLSTPYDRARAVEQHLRIQPYEYTLAPPPPPAGEWPIHFFLLRSHVGYCQYYASSMGTMLRLLGIPTRLVSGYGNGTVDDSASTPRSTLHQVTTSDAHVWVEAYFPGSGWITFEPTPSTQYGLYEPVPRPGSAASATPTPSGAGATATPAPTPAASAAPLPPAAAGSGPTMPPQLVVAVGALAVAGLLVAAGLMWVTRPRNLPALWTRVSLLGRLLGVRRRVGDTDLGYARRVAAALPPDATTILHRRGDTPAVGRRVHDRTADALQQIAALSGKAQFSPTGITRQEGVRWRRAWRRISRVLPVLIWRRLLHGRSAGDSGALPLSG